MGYSVLGSCILDKSAEHRPDALRENPFVERYHRNFKYECQLLEQPQDLAQTRQVNQPYVHFYNYERPNQAITCGNQPPLIKFPDPPALSALPQTVDPDRWLLQQTGKTYTRKLGRDGCFQAGSQTCCVQQKLRGRFVTIWVDGQHREPGIFLDGRVIKKLALSGGVICIAPPPIPGVGCRYTTLGVDVVNNTETGEGFCL